MSRKRLLSILIVDDDQTLRERLAWAFRERGYSARTAGNYDEALSVTGHDPPDLVVADLRMPGRSGLDLVAHFRRLSPSTRIVVLTGYGSVATAVEAMRLGATHYLPKPADVDDIIQAFGRDLPSLPGGRSDMPAPSLERAEWEHIQRVLADCGGNVSEAARRLGLYRRSLQRKLQRYAPQARSKRRPRTPR